MYRYLPILLGMLITLNSNAQSKDELRKDLIGTWVRTESSDKEFLRYVKKNELKENVRGLVFKKDGNVILYEEFGCQLPPNFRSWNASWEVKSKNLVIIDRHYPGEKPLKMKIKKINGHVMKFAWD